jgi:hypothetical protein
MLYIQLQKNQNQFNSNPVMFKKIRTSWKLALLATTISSSLFLSSCKDDENVPTINGDPTVKVTTSATSDVVWNTVTLTIEAADDIKVAKIEVKIDDKVADTQTSSPFDFKWDTHKVDDGTHTVTITASDEAGKQASWTATLKVQNTLLEFTVPDDMLQEWNRGFVFLSDSEGKVIAFEEYENGGPPVKLTAPGYDGKDFQVTECYYEQGEGNYMEITTIADVPRGKWVLSRDYDGEEWAGEVALTFSNVDENSTYEMTSNGDWNYFSGGTETSFWIWKDPSMLFIRKRSKFGDDTHEYALIPAIHVGQNTIDLSVVNKALTEESVSVPSGYDDISVFINGVRTTPTHKEYYSVGGGDGYVDSEAILRYPGNDFSAYYSHTMMRGEILRAENSYNGLYDKTPLNANLDVALTDTKINGSVSGTLDYYTVELDFYGFYWELVSNKGKSIVVPEFPDEIKDLITVPNFTEAPYARVAAYDLGGVNDYAHLLEQIKASTYGFDEFYEGSKETNDKKLSKELVEGKGRIKGNEGRKANGQRRTLVAKRFKHQ